MRACACCEHRWNPPAQSYIYRLQPFPMAHLDDGAGLAVDEQRQHAAERRLDAQRVAGPHPVLDGGAVELQSAQWHNVLLGWGEI